MKNKLRLFSLLLLITAISISRGYGQQEVSWKLLSEKEGVKVYHRYMHCNDAHYALFKIENANDNEVSVTLKTKFIGLKEVLINSGVERTFTIPASNSIVGECDDNSGLSLLTSAYVPSAGDGLYEISIYDLVIQ